MQEQKDQKEIEQTGKELESDIIDRLLTDFNRMADIMTNFQLEIEEIIKRIERIENNEPTGVK